VPPKRDPRWRERKTTIVSAANQLGTLRTSIPKKVVRELEIETGDVLEWEVEGKKGTFRKKAP
jgi:bifunctional DNA-binding transcriptional regulator/antitoxin component of YhaV-PrlF toxin-antitoxin module